MVGCIPCIMRILVGESHTEWLQTLCLRMYYIKALLLTVLIFSC